MAETIKVVDYYYTTCADRPGEGARLLSMLRDAGVNLLAVHAFPFARRTQVDFVPENSRSFMAAARKAKLKINKRRGAFLATGDDRPGVIAEILEKLAEAGVNVTATTALSAGKGQFACIFWVKPAAFRRASKALGL